MSVGTEYPIKKALLGVIILHTRCACDYYREMAPNCTLLCGLNCCPLFGASVFFFFFGFCFSLSCCLSRAVFGDEVVDSSYQTIKPSKSGSNGNKSTCNAGDPGSIPGWRSFPGEENGYPPQYSCLENSRDRGPWRATVHGVAKSQTCRSN